jgi:hypothetical protein
VNVGSQKTLKQFCKNTKEQTMSEVELFYKRTQEKLGGNIPWGELPPDVQQLYVQAVDIILFVAKARKPE